MNTNGHKRSIVATYDYQSGQSELVFQTVRYSPKGFAQRQPDGNGGWIWDLMGVRPILYCLPELLAANPDKPVFIPEGEKHVDRLIKLGLVATTFPMGALKSHLVKNVSALKGRPVVVLPDNDPPSPPAKPADALKGQRHAQQIAERLLPVAKSVKVLELPGLPQKGDILDWLDAGGTVDQLLVLVEQTPPYESASFRISESYILGGSEESTQIRVIPSTEVPLPQEGSGLGLLESFVPDPPALMLLSGESSAGKTVLAYNLAYHLALGLDMAGLKAQRSLRVLYCDLENPDTVHRSLVDIIGRSDDLAFVRVLPNSLNTDIGRGQLLEACHNFGPDVVILDPLSVAWPVDDENDNAKADRQMWGLKRMAMELNCVFICLWNMGEGNVKDKFRARGLQPASTGVTKH